MKNLPERLLERARELEHATTDVRIVGRMNVPQTPAQKERRRTMSLIQMVAQERELGVRIHVCKCTGLAWPHALHLSSRCLGR